MRTKISRVVRAVVIDDLVVAEKLDRVARNTPADTRSDIAVFAKALCVSKAQVEEGPQEGKVE